jgi:hypothetical protein
MRLHPYHLELLPLCPEARVKVRIGLASGRTSTSSPGIILTLPESISSR